MTTSFANTFFLEEKKDPYLENEGSLWLLQYHLCKTKYASIFNIVFARYFSDKATFEFSEYQILNYINRLVSENGQREVAVKTLNSDFKVLIRTFVTPKKKPKRKILMYLFCLNLISDTERKNMAKQTIYRLNKTIQDTLSSEIFGYCLLEEFQNEQAISYVFTYYKITEKIL